MLARRLFRWPFVLTRTFALDHVPAHMLTVILQTSSGATQGGDRLLQRLHVRPDAAAHIATQGATSVHRAGPGHISKDTVAITVEAGGVMEYLPEPRILFPGAALEQTTEIACAVGGVALVADAFTLHDPEAKGGCFRRLSASTTLRCGGDPVLLDRMDVGGLGRGRAARYAAFGSVLLAAPGRPEGMEALATHLTERFAAHPGLYGAASLLPGGDAGIGARLAAADLRTVDAGIKAVWIAARRLLHGAPPDRDRRAHP